uniref:Uncharacterized protein n=1 Tax=Anguilla anguilla TaxID=7936 RepID=A0A0E9PL38_ANGAN
MASIHEGVSCSVQQACGDALSPHQTEHPDPANAANGRLWRGGAAPGPVVVHEVLFGHVLGTFWLLQYPVGLSDVFGDQAADNHLVRVHKQVRFSLAGTTERDLLKS